MFREPATQAKIPEEKTYTFSQPLKQTSRSGKYGIFKFQTNVYR